LRRTVSKNDKNYCITGDSRTVYSSWRPCFHKNCPCELHNSNIHGRAAIAQYIILWNSLLPSYTPYIFYPFLSQWSTSALYPHSSWSTKALPTGRCTVDYSGMSSANWLEFCSGHIPWGGYDEGFRMEDWEVNVQFPNLYLASVS
jgi:hypothetical protein